MTFEPFSRARKLRGTSLLLLGGKVEEEPGRSDTLSAKRWTISNLIPTAKKPRFAGLEMVNTSAAQIMRREVRRGELAFCGHLLRETYCAKLHFFLCTPRHVCVLSRCGVFAKLQVPRSGGGWSDRWGYRCHQYRGPHPLANVQRTRAFSTRHTAASRIGGEGRSCSTAMQLGSAMPRFLRSAAL